MPLYRSLAISLLPLACGALYAQAGTLDPSFGSGGVTFGAANTAFRKVAVQPDGRLVVAGYSSLGNGNRAWLVQRFLDDGTIDTSFGSGGATTLFGTHVDDVAHDLALDSSGRIVVVGETRHTVQNTTHAELTVVRLLASGAPDSSFGQSGVVKVHAGNGNKDGSSARAVAIQADGKIIVGGWAVGRRTSIDLCLVRLTSNGALDSTFGSSGKVLDALSSAIDWPAERSLVLQPDGKILFAASAYWAQSPWIDHGWYVMRYQTNGALDTQWGQGGRVHGAFAGLSRAYLTGLALDASGRVLASGRSWNDVGTSGYDFLTARYLANGTLDATYGGAGYVFSNLDGDDQQSSCGLQADGSFVQGGMVSGFAVATRRLADGSLDATYGTAGFSEPAPLTGPFARSVAIDASGRVVLAAESASGGALVRYRAN